MTVDVIIPALNEEASIGLVIQHLPTGLVRNVYVVDNGSTDQTASVAKSLGAKVLFEKERGYGAACLKALAFIAQDSPEAPPQLVAFIDGDYSDVPEELQILVDTLQTRQLDMVLGSRVLGQREMGSLTFLQRFGNALATTLIKWFYNYHYTDLGPFRVIRYDVLKKLQMADRNYGWTVEMQVKLAKHQFRFAEVPVQYKKRIGISKVSGTFRGVLGAGSKILFIIFKTYVKG